jgi:hypothetical protein
MGLIMQQGVGLKLAGAQSCSPCMPIEAAAAAVHVIGVHGGTNVFVMAREWSLVPTASCTLVIHKA